MVKVYLHVGLPKTATTAIQEWLTENAASLREIGVFTFDGVRYGHRLAIEGIEQQARKELPDIARILHGTKWEEVLPQLQAAAKDPNISRIVISSEYFSVSAPHKMREILAGLSLHDVKIILVLRRQDRYIESNYSQSVGMTGRTRPLGKAAYNVGYDWYAQATSWADAFSRDALLLHIYENAARDGKIIDRVIGSLDSQLSQFVADHPAARVRTNPSLSAAFIEFKRLANCAGAPDVLPFLEAAAERGLAGEPFRMEKTLAKGFLDIHRESNRKVAHEFFGLTGDLFDESDLDAEDGGVDCTGKLSIETLAMLFALYMQAEKDRCKTARASGPSKTHAKGPHVSARSTAWDEGQG